MTIRPKMPKTIRPKNDQIYQSHLKSPTMHLIYNLVTYQLNETYEGTNETSDMKNVHCEGHAALFKPKVVSLLN